jgi:hypothetical protein
LKIQQSNFERIDERQEMQAKEIREKQKLEIEVRVKHFIYLTHHAKMPMRKSLFLS